MRVLWFSNTPSMADKIVGENVISGGWIKSLENYLKKSKIELGIAFYAPIEDKKIQYKKTIYYAIQKRGKNKTLRLLYRFLNIHALKEDITKYIEIINDFKPDIIHIHGTENSFGQILTKTNIPVVISIQGITTVISHKFDRFTSKRKINLNYFSNIIFARSDKIKSRTLEHRSLTELQTLKNAKYIIGRTQWDMNVTRVLAPESKYFSGNEILRDSFYKHHWDSNLKKKLIIHSTSNPVAFKGVETIFKVCELMESLNIDFVWNIAGFNKNNWMLKTAISNHHTKNVNSKINYLGVLNEGDLINKLLDADIYVMTSHIENSSNALSEAMLIGMPCIATFVGGTSSLINHNYNGILVPDDDPWALAGAIYQLYSNFETASDLAANARITAIKRHDPKDITSNLIHIYKQIIEEK